MPAFYCFPHKAVPLRLLLFSLSILLLVSPVLAQVIPKQGHLNAPQSPARAKDKMTIYNGFSVPSGGSFEGELIRGAAEPPLASAITVVADTTVVRSGDTLVLKASGTGGTGNALSFDGLNDWIRFTGNHSQTDSFTWEAWVKPSATHEVDAQSSTGTSGNAGQRYLLYPTQGETWGAGHAGMGISVGTNGVSVYEHASGYLPALLVWTGTLTTWTHIAVVYRNKTPELYINGQLVRTGLTSTRIVHPSTLIGGTSYGFYAGQLDEVRVWNTARSAQEIKGNYQRGVDPTISSLLGYWRFDDPLNSADVPDSRTGTPLNGILFNLPERLASTAPVNRRFNWTGADPNSLVTLLSATDTSTVVFTAPQADTIKYYRYIVSSQGVHSTPDADTVEITVLPNKQIWIGSLSNEWNRRENWANRQVPTPESEVIIPACATCPHLPAHVSIRSLTMKSGKLNMVNFTLQVAEDVTLEAASITSQAGRLRAKDYLEVYRSDISGNTTLEKTGGTANRWKGGNRFALQVKLVNQTQQTIFLATTEKDQVTP